MGADRECGASEVHGSDRPAYIKNDLMPERVNMAKKKAEPKPEPQTAPVQQQPQSQMGRPKLTINWEEFENLCRLQCTEEEIAAWFGVSVATIERRVKEEKGMTFAEFFGTYKKIGHISLRRAQMQMALKNPRMAIW